MYGSPVPNQAETGAGPTVTLDRQGQSLGLEIFDAESSSTGIRIGSVIAGGQADRKGIKSGDTIVRVNGSSVIGLTQAGVVPLITASEHVVLELRPRASLPATRQDGLTQVTLDRRGQSLGLEIFDAESSSTGIRIGSVVAGGQADSKGIKSGDTIVRVNGSSVIGLTQAGVIPLITASEDVLLELVPTRAVTPISTAFNTKLASSLGFENASKTSVRVNKPLGLTFNGDPASGYFVTKLNPGSNSKATGHIVVGTQIIAIDGRAVGGMNMAEVVAVVKSAPSSVEIVVIENQAGFQRMIRSKIHPDAQRQPGSTNIYDFASAAPASRQDGLTQVTLDRRGQKLGLEIFDAESSSTGIRIGSVVAGGQADSKGIKSGDTIVRVNGSSVIGLTQAGVVPLITASDDAIVLDIVPGRPEAAPAAQRNNAVHEAAAKQRQAEADVAQRKKAAQEMRMAAKEKAARDRQNDADIARRKKAAQKAAAHQRQSEAEKARLKKADQEVEISQRQPTAEDDRARVAAEWAQECARVKADQTAAEKKAERQKKRKQAAIEAAKWAAVSKAKVQPVKRVGKDKTPKSTADIPEIRVAVDLSQLVRSAETAPSAAARHEGETVQNPIFQDDAESNIEHYKTVTLDVRELNFGMKIVDATSSDTGAIVSSVVPDGQADKKGITKGDTIVKINSSSALGKTKGETMALMMASDDAVLELAYAPPKARLVDSWLPKKHDSKAPGMRDRATARAAPSSAKHSDHSHFDKTNRTQSDTKPGNEWRDKKYDSITQKQIDRAAAETLPGTGPNGTNLATVTEPSAYSTLYSDVSQGHDTTHAVVGATPYSTVGDSKPYDSADTHSLSTMTVTLDRRAKSLGIEIFDAPSSGAGVPIGRIVQGGEAESKGVRTGDIIVEVNGNSTLGKSQKDITALIVASDDVVLVLSREQTGIETAYNGIGRKDSFSGFGGQERKDSFSGFGSSADDGSGMRRESFNGFGDGTSPILGPSGPQLGFEGQSLYQNLAEMELLKAGQLSAEDPATPAGFEEQYVNIAKTARKATGPVSEPEEGETYGQMDHLSNQDSTVPADSYTQNAQEEDLYGNMPGVASPVDLEAEIKRRASNAEEEDLYGNMPGVANKVDVEVEIKRRSSFGTEAVSLFAAADSVSKGDAVSLAVAKAQGMPEETFHRLDTDNDGMLSPEEFMEGMQENDEYDLPDVQALAAIHRRRSSMKRAQGGEGKVEPPAEEEYEFPDPQVMASIADASMKTSQQLSSEPLDASAYVNDSLVEEEYELPDPEAIATATDAGAAAGQRLMGHGAYANDLPAVEEDLYGNMPGVANKVDVEAEIKRRSSFGTEAVSLFAAADSVSKGDAVSLAVAKAQGMPEETFHRLDTDNDGMLSPEEFMEGMQENDEYDLPDVQALAAIHRRRSSMKRAQGGEGKVEPPAEEEYEFPDPQVMAPIADASMKTSQQLSSEPLDASAYANEPHPDVIAVKDTVYGAMSHAVGMGSGHNVEAGQDSNQTSSYLKVANEDKDTYGGIAIVSSPEILAQESDEFTGFSENSGDAEKVEAELRAKVEAEMTAEKLRESEFEAKVQARVTAELEAKRKQEAEMTAEKLRESEFEAKVQARVTAELEAKRKQDTSKAEVTIVDESLRTKAASHPFNLEKKRAATAHLAVVPTSPDSSGGTEVIATAADGGTDASQRPLDVSPYLCDPSAQEENEMPGLEAIASVINAGANTQQPPDASAYTTPEEYQKLGPEKIVSATTGGLNNQQSPDTSAYEDEPPAEDVAEIMISKPIGLTFHGDAHRGYFVTALKSGGNAELSGKVSIGARILAVDGTKVDDGTTSKKGVVELVKAAPNSVALIIGEDKAGFEALEAARKAQKVG